MLFPFPSIWSGREVDDPGDQIDRHLGDRTHRLVVGLALSDDFKFVNGSLVVTSGRGKYLRVEHSINQRISVPNAISESCLDFKTHKSTHLGELQQLLFDLSAVQADLTDQLKRQAENTLTESCPLAFVIRGFGIKISMDKSLIEDSVIQIDFLI